MIHNYTNDMLRCVGFALHSHFIIIMIIKIIMITIK